MRKSGEELEKINTKNLLLYYKAERSRFYASGYYCSCGCGDYIWEAMGNAKDMKQKFQEHSEYLGLIKSELDKREHVSKPLLTHK